MVTSISESITEVPIDFHQTDVNVNLTQNDEDGGDKCCPWILELGWSAFVWSETRNQDQLKRWFESIRSGGLNHLDKWWSYRLTWIGIHRFPSVERLTNRATSPFISFTMAIFPMIHFMTANVIITATTMYFESSFLDSIPNPRIPRRINNCMSNLM